MTTAAPVTSLPTTARAAAEAALSVLPVTETLTVGIPGTDPATATLPGSAVCARLSGPVTGLLIVVVNQELVDALRTSPLGELDLAQAVAPALDAAAGVLGSAAGPGQEMAPDSAMAALADYGERVFVPLTAEGATHAVVAIGVPVQQPAGTAPALPGGNPAKPAVSGLDLLHGVEMDVTAELGRTRLTVRDLLSLSNGAVIELDRSAGSPADVLVNGRLIARGEVVVIDENFGIRITEILSSADRGQETT